MRARPSHRVRQQFCNVSQQVVVRRKPNRIFQAPFFHRFVDLRLGKRGLGSKHHFLTQYLLAFDFRQKHVLPILGAIYVARSQLRTQTVSLPVEQQQRVIAGRFKMAVVGTVFLFSIDRNFRALDVRCSKLAGNRLKSSVFSNAF